MASKIINKYNTLLTDFIPYLCTLYCKLQEMWIGIYGKCGLQRVKKDCDGNEKIIPISIRLMRERLHTPVSYKWIQNIIKRCDVTDTMRARILIFPRDAIKIQGNLVFWWKISFVSIYACDSNHNA